MKEADASPGTKKLSKLMQVDFEIAAKESIERIEKNMVRTSLLLSVPRKSIEAQFNQKVFA